MFVFELERKSEWVVFGEIEEFIIDPNLMNESSRSVTVAIVPNQNLGMAYRSFPSGPDWMFQSVEEKTFVPLNSVFFKMQDISLAQDVTSFSITIFSSLDRLSFQYWMASSRNL